VLLGRRASVGWRERRRKGSSGASVKDRDREDWEPLEMVALCQSTMVSAQLEAARKECSLFGIWRGLRAPARLWIASILRPEPKSL
jgi:hypothetical protein